MTRFSASGGSRSSSGFYRVLDAIEHMIVHYYPDGDRKREAVEALEMARRRGDFEAFDAWLKKEQVRPAAHDQFVGAP